MVIVLIVKYLLAELRHSANHYLPGVLLFNSDATNPISTVCKFRLVFCAQSSWTLMANFSVETVPPLVFDL